MPREKRSFWEMLFVGSPHEAREEQVLQYVIHRTKAGAKLQDVLLEDYVRRNLSQDEIGEMICNPELVCAAREHLEEAFECGELRPGPAPR